jgi:hypothetical protein
MGLGVLSLNDGWQEDHIQSPAHAHAPPLEASAAWKATHLATTLSDSDSSDPEGDTDANI